MAGIYIHIPFCKQACHYCNFHFSTSLRFKNEMLAALLKEIELQRDYFLQEPVESVYFGGGTPSLCTGEELQSLVGKVDDLFTISDNAEITLEANPDDISISKLTGWKETGINRLSIGVQSFFEEDLKWMNRAHNAKQAIDNLQLALQYFANITIDLIYGTPYLTDEKWKYNVDKAIELNIPHLSCYALTVEPKTPLYKMIHQKKADPVDPDQQSAQFLLLMDWLQKKGYEHYEISNFSKTGFRSRHNSAYWQGKKYLGIGPSAHSFDGKSRQWNVANNNLYTKSISTDIIPFEKEELTIVQQLNEFIMTALRTMEGIDTKILEDRFQIPKNDFLKKTNKYIKNKLIRQEGSSVLLTNEGKLLADGIAADLFF